MVNHKNINFSQRLKEMIVKNERSAWKPLNVPISKKDIEDIFKNQLVLLTGYFEKITQEEIEVLALSKDPSMARLNINYDPSLKKEVAESIYLLRAFLRSGTESWFNKKDNELVLSIKDLVKMKISIPKVILGVGELTPP